MKRMGKNKLWLSVELDRLAIGYRKGRNAIKVVAKDISSVAEGGSLTCLVGRNGEGKSTLLRTVAGLQPSLGGKVLVCGKDIARMGRSERSRTVSVVLTEKPDLERTTVEEMVEMGRMPYTGFLGRLSDADRIVVNQSMEMAGVSDMAQRLFHTLSDGERQKVMIARALAQQTPVMLLDEPTAFLDFPNRIGLMRMMAGIAHSEGKAVLLSTHDIDVALALADRLWVMDNGRMVSGTPRDLASEGFLNQFVKDSGASFDPETLSFKISQSDDTVY